MLARYICFIAILSFFSCSKNPSPATLAGSVSFTANSTAYSWAEENSSTSTNYLTMYIYTSTPGTYHLNISNQFSSYLIPLRTIFITFPAASLTVGTPYTYTNTIDDPAYPSHVISVSNITTNDLAHLYESSKIGDHATITFTSIHNNKADGTFSAALTRASDSAVITITNGSFRNITINP